VTEPAELLARAFADGVRVATGSMRYTHPTLAEDALRDAFVEPRFLPRTTPHGDGRPCIRELVRCCLEDIVPEGGGSGPAALGFAPHPRAPVTDLPVLGLVPAMQAVACVRPEPPPLTLAHGHDSSPLFSRASSPAQTIPFGQAML
jgi:acetoacetate decarboxylase